VAVTAEASEAHWRVTYDADDGEPIGEVCRCEIGEDHKGSGAGL
jgi:hypothetical protein